MNDYLQLTKLNELNGVLALFLLPFTGFNYNCRNGFCKFAHMKKSICLLILLAGGTLLFAQSAPVAAPADSVITKKVTVDKDHRIDLLAKAQYDIATANTKMAARFTKGYRLFLLKTDDREYAMKVRAYLLQNFPEEKVIMSYQAPFIKMKFGDFVDKADAEKIKKQITRGGVVKGGIYVVPDTIELKPDKDGKEDSK